MLDGFKIGMAVCFDCRGGEYLDSTQESRLRVMAADVANDDNGMFNRHSVTFCLNE